jgi:hypothetical protein
MGWIGGSHQAHNALIEKERKTKMILLHIEHTVMDFDNWKASFDSYEEFRQKSGVCRYRVSRPVDNANYAVIDLEFDTLGQAEALLANVQQVWQRVDGTLIKDPQWRFSQVVEEKELQL